LPCSLDFFRFENDLDDGSYDEMGLMLRNLRPEFMSIPFSSFAERLFWQEREECSIQIGQINHLDFFMTQFQRKKTEERNGG
jgi:hypothetical protein